jgi:hypothetical protein
MNPRIEALLDAGKLLVIKQLALAGNVPQAVWAKLYHAELYLRQQIDEEYFADRLDKKYQEVHNVVA